VYVEKVAGCSFSFTLFYLFAVTFVIWSSYLMLQFLNQVFKEFVYSWYRCVHCMCHNTAINNELIQNSVTESVVVIIGISLNHARTVTIV